MDIAFWLLIYIASVGIGAIILYLVLESVANRGSEKERLKQIQRQEQERRAKEERERQIKESMQKAYEKYLEIIKEGVNVFCPSAGDFVENNNNFLESELIKITIVRCIVEKNIVLIRYNSKLYRLQFTGEDRKKDFMFKLFADLYNTEILMVDEFEWSQIQTYKETKVVVNNDIHNHTNIDNHNNVMPNVVYTVPLG